MDGWPEAVPELDDGRVRLRAHRESDLPAIVEMCQDPLTRRWTDLPDPYGLTDAESFIHERVAAGWRAGTARGWAIESVDSAGSARFAGNLDIRGGPAADIGFALHPLARGDGVMSAAVRLALRWCFAETGIESVLWQARAGNVASRRVAWTCGFTFHGTLPRQLGRPPLADAWIATVVDGDELRPRTRWLIPSRLRDERVVLRAFDDSDIPRIVEACSDPVTRHWLASLPSPYTTESARAYLDGMADGESVGRRVSWCVADPTTEQLLGSLTIFDLGGDDPGSGELGYWTHADARGRGVMTAAVRLGVEYALRPQPDGGLGLRRLQLLAAEGNPASASIARRVGFAETGRKRQADLLGDGRYADMLTFDILATPPPSI